MVSSSCGQLQLCPALSCSLSRAPGAEGRDTAAASALSTPLPIPNPCAEASAGLESQDSSFLMKAAFPDREKHQAGLVRGIQVPLPRVWCGCTGPCPLSPQCTQLWMGLRAMSRAPQRSIWRPFIPLN